MSRTCVLPNCSSDLKPLCYKQCWPSTAFVECREGFNTSLWEGSSGGGGDAIPGFAGTKPVFPSPHPLLTLCCLSSCLCMSLLPCPSLLGASESQAVYLPATPQHLSMFFSLVPGHCFLVLLPFSIFFLWLNVSLNFRS